MTRSVLGKWVTWKFNQYRYSCRGPTTLVWTLTILWLGHFHNLLCKEILFPLHSGEKWWLQTSVHHFFPYAVEISFLLAKVCGNDSFPLCQWSKYSFIPGGVFIYFMQLPAFYLFCRKSSDKINENSRKNKWKCLH